MRRLTLERATFWTGIAVMLLGAFFVDVFMIVLAVFLLLSAHLMRIEQKLKEK